MSDPMNVKINGHVENADSTQITKEQFNAIKSGDTVFLKNGETGVMRHRLTRSIYLSDKNRTQVYPEDLRPPYFLKKSEPKKETLQQVTVPTEQKQATVKKTVEIPVKSKTRLDLLIEKYPRHTTLIQREFKIIGVSYDDIEAIVLMTEAAEAVR